MDRVAPTSLSLNSNVKANLQYVGASSDAPALKAAGGNADDGTLRFGISTWANWDVVSYENTFTVEIDTDGNNRADYKLVTDRAKGLTTRWFASTATRTVASSSSPTTRSTAPGAIRTPT